MATRRSYAGGAAALALSGGTLSATGLSFTTTGTASGWPDGSGGKFLVVIDRGTATEEKMLCSARSGNTFTVAAVGDRGKDNTTGQSHLNNAPVEHVVGAIDLDEPNAHIALTTQDDHTQYLRTDGTRAFSAVTAIAAAPGNSAPGDVAAAGTALTLGRSDHKHGREGFAAPSASAVGDVQAAGSAATIPHSDHVHAREAFAGTGSATTVAHSDHTHTASTLGTVGYASSTSGQSGIVASTDVTGCSVTFTTVAGRRYKITGFVPGVSFTNTSDIYQLKIMRDGTVIETCPSGVGASGNTTLHVVAVDTPSAASHTYKLNINWQAGGNGLNTNPSATQPNFILIEDIGT